MPHKKPKRSIREFKRLKVEEDAAPDAAPVNSKPNKKRKRASNNSKEDDKLGGGIPKAFQRILDLQNRHKQGMKRKDFELDTGVRKKRPADGDAEAQKKKKAKKAQETKEKETEKKQELKIQPGEKMSDFKRRVNEALPMVKPDRDPKDTTVKGKKAKKAATKAEGEDGDEEEDEGEDRKKRTTSGRTIRRREPSPDPFAHLATTKKFGDIVQEPPTLTARPRLREGALGIPKTIKKADGSGVEEVTMAKRVMLGREREEMIRKYRELMASKKAAN
ncbi:hypothetical protein YB2330_000540 [Saitoella coloradoensis]